MSELPRIPPTSPVSPHHPLRPVRESGREPRRQTPEQKKRKSVDPEPPSEADPDATVPPADGRTDSDPSGGESPPRGPRVDLRV